MFHPAHHPLTELCWHHSPHHPLHLPSCLVVGIQLLYHHSSPAQLLCHCYCWQPGGSACSSPCPPWSVPPHTPPCSSHLAEPSPIQHLCQVNYPGLKQTYHVSS